MDKVPEFVSPDIPKRNALTNHKSKNRLTTIPRGLQKPLLALFRQLVPKGFKNEGYRRKHKDSWETRYEHSCRDPNGLMTESLAKASDREEPC